MSTNIFYVFRHSESCNNDATKVEKYTTPQIPNITPWGVYTTILKGFVLSSENADLKELFTGGGGENKAVFYVSLLIRTWQTATCLHIGANIYKFFEERYGDQLISDWKKEEVRVLDCSLCKKSLEALKRYKDLPEGENDDDVSGELCKYFFMVARRTVKKLEGFNELNSIVFFDLLRNVLKLKLTLDGGDGLQLSLELKIMPHIQEKTQSPFRDYGNTWRPNSLKRFKSWLNMCFGSGEAYGVFPGIPKGKTNHTFSLLPETIRESPTITSSAVLGNIADGGLIIKAWSVTQSAFIDLFPETTSLTPVLEEQSRSGEEDNQSSKPVGGMWRRQKPESEIWMEDPKYVDESERSLSSGLDLISPSAEWSSRFGNKFVIISHSGTMSDYLQKVFRYEIEDLQRELQRMLPSAGGRTNKQSKRRTNKKSKRRTNKQSNNKKTKKTRRTRRTNKQSNNKKLRRTKRNRRTKKIKRKTNKKKNIKGGSSDESVSMGEESKFKILSVRPGFGPKGKYVKFKVQPPGKTTPVSLFTDKKKLDTGTSDSKIKFSLHNVWGMKIDWGSKELKEIIPGMVMQDYAYTKSKLKEKAIKKYQFLDNGTKKATCIWFGF